MRVAVFTMVYNESIFLPIWRAYYSAQVGVENLFILDHGSTDNSTKSIVYNIVRLPRSTLDEIERASAVSSFRDLLLEYYDVVIFCDADEIIIPDPKIYSSLIDYLRQNQREVIAPAGLALLHVPDLEPKFDFSRPLLQQRSWVRFQALYAKPVITRVNVDWTPGFHSASNINYNVEEDIYLIHLKAMDYEIAHAELRKRNDIALSDRAKELHHDAQFQLKVEQFDNIYFSTTAQDTSRCTNFEILGSTIISGQRREVLVDLKSSFGELVRLPERFQNSIPLTPRLQTRRVGHLSRSPSDCMRIYYAFVKQLHRIGADYFR